MPNSSKTLAAITLLLLAPATILYRYPPDRFFFYPLCPIYRYTGLLCPGCGATRALAALLHGHLAEAFHHNALLMLLLPLLFLYLFQALKTPQQNTWPQIPPALTWSVLLAATIFTAARNLF